MIKNLIISAIVLFITQGCALQIGLLNPQTEINLTKTNKSIKLIINDKVPDKFTVQKYAGISKSKIVDWHSSLHNGFNNGFSPYFKLKTEEISSDLTLEIQKAGIKFIPFSVSGYQNGTALKVQLDFTATVSDNTGEFSETFSENVLSNKIIYHKGQENEAVSNAVEKMYQLIAKKSLILNGRK